MCTLWYTTAPSPRCLQLDFHAPYSTYPIRVFPEGCVWTRVDTCVSVAECICMCSLSCLSQWADALQRWRRVCFFDTKSRQRDGKLGHRASLFSGSPGLPRPELFIRLGEVTHTSIIHCASLVSSYPCRRHCCENPKGELHWAPRSSRLTVTQHFATAAHCDRICIS